MSFSEICFKGSVNPEIVKNITRCNFLIITVMYIKVYISGMEMSQRIHFLYQILLKVLMRKWQKNTFLVKNSCDKLKNHFELKMLKLLENYVKTLL